MGISTPSYWFRLGKESWFILAGARFVEFGVFTASPAAKLEVKASRELWHRRNAVGK